MEIALIGLNALEQRSDLVLAMEENKYVIQRRPSHSLSSHPRRRLAITRRTSLLISSDCRRHRHMIFWAARRRQLAEAAE